MTLITLVHHVLEAMLIYIFLVLISRFVFLENGIRDKYAKWFHLVALIATVTFKLINPSVYWDESLAIVFLAISIILGRKHNHFTALLLVFPILGILDGLMVPIVVMPTMFFDNNEDATILYQTGVYIVVLIMLIACFMFWRKEILDSIQDTDERSLKVWERALLCFIGVMLLFYSEIMSQTRGIQFGSNEQLVTLLLFFFSVVSFLMSLSIITLVIVGNKQTHYLNTVFRMQFNIIIMMAEIVENRDKNTGGHIKRTAKYVEIIAKQLKRNKQFTDILTDSYIDNMCVAAPLHDIGKIHVSDTILNKEGPLTEEEFEIMKTHSEEGAKLLSQAKKHLGDFEYLDIAMQMAGGHHEWYDGSDKGYPGKVSGDDIPLCARIMAVADVFDALITKRCYKSAMPIKRAYKIIREESGTHFDPVIVTAFFTAQAHIEAALNEFNKELLDEPGDKVSKPFDIKTMETE